MNEIKPPVGVEFEDKYINKLIEFVRALNDLSSTQREQLAREFIASTGMAASIEQFIKHMNHGGI